MIKTICIVPGRKPSRISLPLKPVSGLIALAEKAGKLIGIKSPVTKAMLNKYTEEIRVNGTRIQKELGFTPQYKLNTGWHETINQMRSTGTL